MLLSRLSGSPANDCEVTLAYAARNLIDANGNIIPSVQSVLSSNSLYVTTGGNDSTGARGDISKPYATIQPALNAALAGDMVTVGPGTWDIGSLGTGTGRIVIPANVNLRGAGRGITIIKSDQLCTVSPFTGFVVPGNNSIISDLSAVGYKAGGGTQNTTPIARLTGAVETWTNVRVERCNLYGLVDVVLSTTTMGDMTFIDCLIEGPIDIFIWQHAGTAILINCELRHTTLVGFEGSSGIGMSDGGAAGAKIKAYRCRYTLGGSVVPTGVLQPAQADTHMELYDFVIDYNGLGTGSASSRDIAPTTSGAMFISNVRRADGVALNFDTTAPYTEYQPKSPVTVAKLPLNPVKGQQATVSDGTAALAWGATVTGGGAVTYLVFYNGTAWTVVGK